MSNEENTKDAQETVSEVAAEAVDKVEEAVSEAAEKVEAAADKAGEMASKAGDAAKDAAGNALSSVLRLKDENPKLFYGGLAVVLIPLIITMTSGRNPEIISASKDKNLTVGQRYALKSSNSYDPGAKVRLVSTPGTLAAYDDTEESDRIGTCQHLPEGTPVTALDFSASYGQPKAFVKVQVEEGECKGTVAWALGIDVQ